MEKDAIEQSLDTNQHLIHNPAATFAMQVEGDLLVVDRSQTVQDGSLVVAALALWAGLCPSLVLSKSSDSSGSEISQCHLQADNQKKRQIWRSGAWLLP